MSKESITIKNRENLRTEKIISIKVIAGYKTGVLYSRLEFVCQVGA